MKILYLINSMRSGGPSNVINTIIQNINSKNNIYLITLFAENHDKYLKKLPTNVTYIALDIKRKELLNSGQQILFNTINEIKPDIIHSNGVIPDYLVSKLKKYPKITTIHNVFKKDYLNRYGFLKGYLLKIFHERILKKFNLVVACSNTVAKELKVKNKMFIRNGIILPKLNHDARISIRKEYNIPNNANLFIYVGGLIKGKKVVELIELFQKNKSDEDYLMILGEGPEQENCLKLASKYVKVLGYQKEVMNFLVASDVYISTSLTEGYSMSVLEALATNNLLLLSAIPAHQEVININEEFIGLTFKDDFDQKYQEIKKHLGKDISKEFIAQNVDGKNMASKYMKIYNEIVGESK